MRNIVVFQALGRYGRFANQLYQIAGTIGIARRNGFDVAFPRWVNYDALNFGETADVEVQKYFENPLPLYEGADLPQLGVPWGYHDVRPKHSVNILGHFQSVKYFAHCLEEVKWYFTMKNEPPMNDYCAIHWRAGDYGEQPTEYKPGGNPYHPRMNLNYYEPAIGMFPKGQQFLVFSDDVENAQRMLDRIAHPDWYNFEYSKGKDYLEDFKLMKRCRHFIIANSSYSAMAAVLGEAADKKVIAPAPWFGGPYLAALDPKDIYNPEWTIFNYQNGNRN